MRKNFPIYILLGILLSAISFSCNDNVTTGETTVLSSSTAITSFKLQADDSVLTNLDSVYFSIDLAKAEIYNADSLPKGTDVSKLLVKMEFASCNSADFHVTGGTCMKDSTFKYSESDSIDFTGDVKFTMVSQDLLEKRTYTIKVNVHNMEPDTLYWSQTARRDLPTTTSTPIAQKTVKCGDNFYCLTQTGASEYVMATATTPDSRDWTKQSVTFGFMPDVNTLTATTEALYILDKDGRLYESADGKSWSTRYTNSPLYSLLGSYEGKLLGVTKIEDKYYHYEYPESNSFVSTELEEGFPVKGMSQMITINTKWSVSPQNVMIGGVSSTGTTVGSAWGYDGSAWGKVSVNEIEGHEGMTIFPYYTFSVSTKNWSVTEYPILIATGGKKADGTLDKTVYASYDQGVTWAKASTMLQLPEYMPAFMNAQAFVYSSTLPVSRSNDGWESLPQGKLPAWYIIEGAVNSRATKPIDSWECPYIYVFGGTNGAGELYNNVWKGVINRLTFKPIY